MNSLSWLTQIAEQSPLLMTAVLMVTAVLVVKVTILLAAAWTAHVLLRRMNPRWSVLLWRLTGVGVMVVIGLAMAPPLVSWAVLPTEDDVPMPSSSFDRLHSASLGSRPVDATPADDPSATDFAAPTDTDERSQAEAHLPWEESIGGSSVTVRNDADFAADSAVPAGLSASQSETAAITPTAQSSRGAFRLMCLWFAGFLASTVWTLSGLLRLRRIVCASRAVPDWMTGEAAIVSQRFGNRRGFDVRQSNEVATPCLIGILRPVVLLPSKQSRDIRRGELVAVLAHEAAHVSGRDLTWNTALHALSLVFWFHPLMWRVRAAHAAACDAVADSVAAGYLNDAPAYSRILARLAVRLHGPAPAAALAMARCSDVRRRIEALQRRLFPHRLKRRSVMMAITLTMLAAVALGGVGFSPAQREAGEGAAAVGDGPGGLSSTSRAAPQNGRLLAQINDNDEPPNDEPQPGLDLYGDPLPDGAVARLGTVRYRHPGSDKHIEFIPGTSMFAVGESMNDHSVRVYDARSGRMLRKIDVGDGYLEGFRVAPDGKSIVTLSHTKEGERLKLVYHMRLVVWDAKTGEEVRPITWDDAQFSRSTQLALSPDGKTAAVGKRDGVVEVWDLPWGEVRLRKNLVERDIESLEFSPDGKMIAVAGRRSVVLWDYQTDDEPQQLPGLERGAQVVRFSPDGKLLAVGSSDAKAARLYEVASGKLVRELAGAGRHYSRGGLCFSQSGDRLYVPESQNAVVEVFEVNSGKVVRTLETGKTGAGDPSLSSDGRLLASVSGSATVVWDLETGERISDRFVGHHEPVYALALTPDGRQVVSGSPLEGTLRVWDAGTGRQERTFADEWRIVVALAVSPQGRWLASCGIDDEFNDTVRLWDLSTAQERYRFPGHGKSGAYALTQVAFSPDERRFYSFGTDFNLRSYSIETGRILTEHAIRPKAEPEGVDEGQFDPIRPEGFGRRGGAAGPMILNALLHPRSERLLLYQARPPAIYSFSIDTGDQLDIIRLDDTVSEFALSPRGDLLTTVETHRDEEFDPNVHPPNPDHYRHFLRLRNPSTGQILQEVPVDDPLHARLDFSNDGALLCVTQSTGRRFRWKDKWIDVRRVDTLKRIARISGFDDTVHAVALSHDGARLATSHEDSTVMVWDLERFRTEGTRP